LRYSDQRHLKIFLVETSDRPNARLVKSALADASRRGRFTGERVRERSELEAAAEAVPEADSGVNRRGDRREDVKTASRGKRQRGDRFRDERRAQVQGSSPFVVIRELEEDKFCLPPHLPTTLEVHKRGRLVRNAFGIVTSVEWDHASGFDDEEGEAVAVRQDSRVFPQNENGGHEDAILGGVSEEEEDHHIEIILRPQQQQSGGGSRKRAASQDHDSLVPICLFWPNCLSGHTCQYKHPPVCT